MCLFLIAIFIKKNVADMFLLRILSLWDMTCSIEQVVCKFSFNSLIQSLVVEMADIHP
jgi:hypothetical protein